jgi:hypothetical protein
MKVALNVMKKSLMDIGSDAVFFAFNGGGYSPHVDSLGCDLPDHHKGQWAWWR